MGRVNLLDSNMPFPTENLFQTFIKHFPIPEAIKHEDIFRTESIWMMYWWRDVCFRFTTLIVFFFELHDNFSIKVLQPMTNSRLIVCTFSSTKSKLRPVNRTMTLCSGSWWDEKISFRDAFFSFAALLKALNTKSWKIKTFFRTTNEQTVDYYF